MPTDFWIAIAQHLLQLRYNLACRGVLLAEVIDRRDTLLTATFAGVFQQLCRIGRFSRKAWHSDQKRKRESANGLTQNRNCRHHKLLPCKRAIRVPHVGTSL